MPEKAARDRVHDRVNGSRNAAPLHAFTYVMTLCVECYVSELSRTTDVNRAPEERLGGQRQSDFYDQSFIRRVARQYFATIDRHDACRDRQAKTAAGAAAIVSAGHAVE